MSMSYQQADAIIEQHIPMFALEEQIIHGRATRCWKNAPPSMRAIFENTLQFGDKEYIVYEGERLSYSQHYQQVVAIGNWLTNECGISKGDRVAIAMRNYPEWSVAFWATVSIGAIVVPINAWWTSEELEYGLNDSGARVLFADQDRFGRYNAIEKPTSIEKIVVARGAASGEKAIDYTSLVKSLDPEARLPHVDIAPDDDATIFYTSGTTGFPKGTLGTHRNYCSVVMNLGHTGVQTFLRSGGELQNLAALQGIPQATLLTVPLFHVTGCHGTMLSMFSTGGKMVIMYKWNPEQAAQLIEAEKITFFTAVPTMIWQLLDAPESEKSDLSSLMTLAYGGAPAPPELLRMIQTKTPHVSIANGWGLTEVSSGAAAINGEAYVRKPDSVGPPVKVLDVKAFDENGNELPTNELGELWIKGATVVKGYWNKPEATAESFTDGWFHTGDIGMIDDEGFVYIKDRLKDMIIRGGENVYCAEVEAALVEHPNVSAACVFGVPHKVLGEEVAAVIEVNSTDALTPEILTEHATKTLAKYKIPSHMWLQTEPLPVGVTGKVQKKELKAHYSALLAN